MVITIIADTYGKENNGTTITLARLVRGLIERGHEVRMVSAFESDDPMYYTLPKRNFYMFNGYVAKNGVALAKPDRGVLEEAITGSDVVHIAVPFKTGALAVQICREKNIPFTAAFHIQAENVTVHFGLMAIGLANRYIYRRFFNKVYKYANIVHCPSERIANILKAHGYNMELRVISNGVVPEFTPAPQPKPEELKDKFIISFVGRYCKEKRHKMLVEAVKASKYKDKIQLIFPGEGPTENAIKKASEKLINKPIMGFYDNTDLIKILRYSDLYVHPSDIEIEAISCLEAICCGAVPIISDSPKSATNAFALSERSLFKHDNVEDLKRKIEFFIEHPEELETERALYADYGEKYAISPCIDKMVKMFEDAIAIDKAN